MIKDLDYLNSKWWYRLVKVIFLGFLLLCATFSIALIIDGSKPREVQDYKISCIADYSNKKAFYAEKDADIYIYQSGTDTLYQSLSDNDKQRIKDRCDISKEETESAIKTTIDYINQQEKLGVDKQTIQTYIDSNLRPYTITFAYRTDGGYIEVILYSLLSLVGILVVGEIIRRIFYYIVLGSFIPKSSRKES